MPQLTPRAKKQLDKPPTRLSAQARELIRRLDRRLDDEPHPGKKLIGRLHRKRSARLGRSHRIIYTAAEGRVVVLTIRPRKDEYR